MTRKVRVKLVGEDGNAFAILGRCRQAMRDAGWPQAEIDAFFTEATSGDYQQLLQTVLKFTEEPEDEPR